MSRQVTEASELASVVAGETLELPLPVSLQSTRDALRARGLDVTPDLGGLLVIRTRYAVVDAEGCSGPQTTVYFASGGKAAALAWAEQPRCRVIEMAGAVIGDRVYVNTIPQVYHEITG